MSSGEDRDARSVRETYETIASHFSETRAHPWPEVTEFVEAAPDVATGLDLGCGNGRHAAVLRDRADRVLALDASRNLLDEADDTVDLAVYVATLHHLPSRDHRRRSLDELARVLAPEGQALVSAWSTAHDRFDADADAETGFDTTIDWTLPGGETVPRFYHIYAPAEFEADLEASDCRLIEFEVSSGNCYARVGGRESERKHP
jgi:ubiquinone/menaquinone biosynthesis C-methylase UbiE